MKPKHIWSAALLVVLAFIAINIRTDMRRPKAGQYGRLSGEAMPVDTQPVEIVAEAPVTVTDQTAADPMLVAPAAREQLLHANTNAAPQPQPQPMIAPVATTPVVVAPEQAVDRRGTSRFTIVGGPEGVAVLKRGE